MFRRKKKFLTFSTGMNLGILLGIVLCILLIAHARARTASDWDEFEDVHGCYDDIGLHCAHFQPKTNAVLDCLYEHYDFLSLQCWHDLDFFAKKFPNSRWSRFERKE